MRKYTERLDLYAINITYIDTGDIDKVFEKYGIEYNGFGGTTVEPMNGTVYLLVNTKAKDFKLDVFAHECVHAANTIFKSRDIKHDIDNDEPFAYLVSWIFAQGYYKLIKK